jgi:hypothetical protein
MREMSNRLGNYRKHECSLVALLTKSSHNGAPFCRVKHTHVNCYWLEFTNKNITDIYQICASNWGRSIIGGGLWETTFKCLKISRACEQIGLMREVSQKYAVLRTHEYVMIEAKIMTSATNVVLWIIDLSTFMSAMICWKSWPRAVVSSMSMFVARSDHQLCQWKTSQT